MSLKRFSTGDIILHPGEEIWEFYVVLKGKVSIYNEEGDHISDYLTGQCFNEESVTQEIIE